MVCACAHICVCAGVCVCVYVCICVHSQVSLECMCVQHIRIDAAGFGSKCTCANIAF